MEIGMHHIGTYCRSIEESIAFYQNILGFKHLFSTAAMEGDKPLKMAWLKSNKGVIVELLEQEDKSPLSAHAHCLNHLSVRVDSIDDIISTLSKHNIPIEAGPFDALCEFDRPLDSNDDDVFKVYGPGGARLIIVFFRGPGGERIEAVQDNIGALS